MRFLEAGVDTAAIYLHAHLGIKEKALARTAQAHTEPERYQPRLDGLRADGRSETLL